MLELNQKIYIWVIFTGLRIEVRCSPRNFSIEFEIQERKIDPLIWSRNSSHSKSMRNTQ
jgi:hypothetical protein